MYYRAMNKSSNLFAVLDLNTAVSYTKVKMVPSLAGVEPYGLWRLEKDKDSDDDFIFNVYNFIENKFLIDDYQPAYETVDGTTIKPIYATKNTNENKLKLKFDRTQESFTYKIYTPGSQFILNNYSLNGGNYRPGMVSTKPHNVPDEWLLIPVEDAVV